MLLNSKLKLGRLSLLLLLLLFFFTLQIPLNASIVESPTCKRVYGEVTRKSSRPMPLPLYYSIILHATVVSGGRERGYSGSDGMIEWGINQNPKKSLGLPTYPQKSLDQTITPRKFHAEFPSLNSLHKA